MEEKRRQKAKNNVNTMHVSVKSVFRENNKRMEGWKAKKKKLFDLIFCTFKKL
jgi:hypothetical protein